MNMVNKICVVCGRGYSVTVNNASRSEACSPSCNRIKWRNRNNDRYKSNKIRYRRECGILEKGSQEHRFKIAMQVRDQRPESNIKSKRNLKIRKVGGWFSKLDWDNLKKQHDYRCLCCGKKEPAIKLTKDHIIPLSKGGSNNISNIQPLCIKCNNKKWIKVVDYKTNATL